MHYFNTVLYWKRCANSLGKEGAKLKKKVKFFLQPLKDVEKEDVGLQKLAFRLKGRGEGASKT